MAGYLYSPVNKRQEYAILRSQLENERASFLQHWRSLSDFILPRRAKFTTSDVNRGDRRNQNIIDSTASLAVRTLSSGMMAGITSPARPWFRLTTPDPDLADFGSVKMWLDIVTKRMSSVMIKSNLYNAFPILYKDIGVFGTSAMLVDEDFEDTLRCYTFPIGSYKIANNDKLKVDVFNRDFRLTVRQVVEKFGQKKLSGSVDWSNISNMVKNQWDNSNYENWIEICHVIQPNKEYDSQMMTAQYKKYSSCYFETGSIQNANTNYLGDMDQTKFLRESGYDYFPVLCPRWEISGEDIYGTDCPGMSALGDIRALQTMQKRKAQAVEKIINPPMVGPTSLRTVKTTILPGDITYTDEREGQKGFRAAHEIQMRVNELTADIQDTRYTIKRAFYEDLFLMLSQTDRRDITAREIDERHEEKLLALGPVLEQLNQDLLDPLIDVAFDMMMRQGQIPPPPKELSGVSLRVDYISIMAQAQKLVGIGSIERFAGFVNQIGAVQPNALDKVDTDKMIDVYGDLTSVPPGIVRSGEDVANIRDARAKQQAAQAQAEALKNAAGAARDLGQTPTAGNNALTQLMGNSNAGALVPQ